MSGNFIDKEFDFTQPDGSTIRLKGSGDQHSAVFKDVEGRVMVRDAVTGRWVGAAAVGGIADAELADPVTKLPHPLLRGRRWEERRQERREQQRALRLAADAGGPLLAPPQRRTVGDFVGLCLLIDFSDAPATISRDEVERFCNKPGYDGFGNKGSVYDYFLDNSIGRLRYTNIVAPYFRAPSPKSFYTDRTIPYGARAQLLIRQALTHLVSQGFDFSALTADNQGYVYATNVYYAGSVDNAWGEGLWPHASRLNNRFAVTAGKWAFDYQFTAMKSEPTLGTFCHENGHMLCDYPDLYDDDEQHASSGVGAFCLMCAGNNANEKNPTAISAYLKRLSGWANSVRTIEHGATITLSARTNDFAIWSRGSREYFLVECRERAGRDASLPDAGLAIWHVDEDGDNSREQMQPGSHYELSLEQADGRFDLERKAYQMGDGGDLYAGAGALFADHTVPSSKWWNGAASNLTIENISNAGSEMTFHCRLSDVATPPAVLSKSAAPNVPIPDNDAAGVSDTITVAEALAITSVKVDVEIEHPYRGDLRVTLTTPWGITLELHPKGRGAGEDHLITTFDDASVPALATLRGGTSSGAWRLTVQDLAAADVGRLKKWGLRIAGAGNTAVELKESAGVAIPDAPAAGIQRTLHAVSTAALASVEVSVDISHSWSGDLRLSLVSPKNTEVVLQDRVGGSDDNIVKTFTAATTPALAQLAGQPIQGAWTLKVQDLEAQDTGKLNAWRLRLS